MTVNLTLREARPRDISAITRVLAASSLDGSVARWLDPDPDTRRMHALAYFGDIVGAAYTTGVVRVAADSGEIVGAALWFLHPIGEVRPDDVGEPASGVQRRLRLLDRLLDERHPRDRAHQHLAYLGVRPDRQNQGIGGALLIGHHAFLHVTGVPAYLEANDERNRELYLRHGYTDVGAPIVLPTGIPIWPMWRPPVAADAPFRQLTVDSQG